MSDTLKLVLTDHWFDEIKSGRKTHEYRLAKWFWIKRLIKDKDDQEDFYRFTIGDSDYADINPRQPFDYKTIYKFTKVEFQKAYRKNAEKMIFDILDIKLINGKDSDLKVNNWVFDIELGERIN